MFATLSHTMLQRCLLGLFLMFISQLQGKCWAQSPGNEKCVVIELFTRAQCQDCDSAKKLIANIQRNHPRTRLVLWELDQNEKGAARLDAIAKAFQVDKPVVPSVYLGRQLISGFDDEEVIEKILEDMFTIHVYWREGCPHCAEGKKFLAAMMRQYPMYTVEYHEIVSDLEARRRFEELTRRFQIQAPVVPTFHLFGQVVSGFFDESSTGKRLESLAKGGLGKCEPAVPLAKPNSQGLNLRSLWDARIAAVALLKSAAETPLESEDGAIPDDEFDLPLPVPIEPTESTENGITLPYFGRLRVREIGLPAFTLAIGLVDGFNPCAMWVLLFLLSILVNLHDRRKIVIVAGAFVVVSGLVYLAFMAAWLNVFLLIGYMRPAQIALGILAVVVGVINVKDYFAFKWGVTLSIPESAKPGIYARVRNIVNAKQLWVALMGAVALAVVVNAVELLCSAGLPAMFTQILSQQELPLWKNYAYLCLYIGAYMFDDTIMLSVVVITLAKTKLQETGGRWLKLLSGVVILALGLTMLFKPDWLY